MYTIINIRITITHKGNITPLAVCKNLGFQPAKNFNLESAVAKQLEGSKNN